MSYAARIASHLGTNGLLNFDAQVTDQGEVYLLECNPRMYLNLDYAALAGMNFVQQGLRDWTGHSGPPLRVPDQHIKTPAGLLKLLTTPWRTTPADLRMTAFRWKDPLPQVIELSRLIKARLPLNAFRPLAPNAGKFVAP